MWGDFVLPKRAERAGPDGRRRHRHHAVRLAAAPRPARRGGPRHRARLRRIRGVRARRSATSSRHPASRSSSSRAISRRTCPRHWLWARGVRLDAEGLLRVVPDIAARHAYISGPAGPDRRPRPGARAGAVDHDRRVQRLLTASPAAARQAGGARRSARSAAAPRTSCRPGVLAHRDRPAVRLDDRARRSTVRDPCRRSGARASGPRARSARTAPPTTAGSMPGPSSWTRRTASVPSRDDADRHRRSRRGVRARVREQVARRPGAGGRRRRRSTTGSSPTSSTQLWSGPAGRASPTASIARRDRSTEP